MRNFLILDLEIALHSVVHTTRFTAITHRPPRMYIAIDVDGVPAFESSGVLILSDHQCTIETHGVFLHNFIHILL